MPGVRAGMIIRISKIRFPRKFIVPMYFAGKNPRTNDKIVTIAASTSPLDYGLSNASLVRYSMVTSKFQSGNISGNVHFPKDWRTSSNTGRITATIMAMQVTFLHMFFKLSPPL